MTRLITTLVIFLTTLKAAAKNELLFNKPASAHAPITAPAHAPAPTYVPLPAPAHYFLHRQTDKFVLQYETRFKTVFVLIVTLAVSLTKKIKNGLKNKVPALGKLAHKDTMVLSY